MKHIARILVLIITALAAPHAGAQNLVQLRESASVDDATPITIGELCDVRGPDAKNIAGVPVVSDLRDDSHAGWVNVTLDEVRRALIDAGLPIGRIALSGSSDAGCAARFGRSERTAAATSMGSQEREPRTVDSSGTTVLAAIARRLRVDLDVADDADLRLGSEAADAEFLGTSCENLRCDVQVVAAGRSARTQVNVFLFGGDQLVERRAVVLETHRRHDAVRLKEAVPRRREISVDVVEPAEVWLAPGESPVSLDELAMGFVAAETLSKGTVLLRRHVLAPVVIQRGESATIHCIAGGGGASNVQVSTMARAMKSGRIGELVEFQTPGSGRTFMARMSARGVAVMVVQ